MASNAFGKIFKIITWGESHGKAVGVVIDGCPAGLEISEAEIQAELARRAPGKSPYTSPRKEVDEAEILSGIFEGKTTGSPICIVIPNRDADSSKYEPLKNILRPGHANYTYLEKYGIFDYRGSGRASARETACRVAAGAIAKKLLQWAQVEVAAYIKQIGHCIAEVALQSASEVRTRAQQSLLSCPCPQATATMMAIVDQAKAAGDSVGGVVEFMATSVPVGLGDPVYAKLEASLASAMMSLPATKGFEMGAGFSSASMRGSEHNDLFTLVEGKVQTRSNHAGGTLAGISNGMPLIGRVAFKPAASIRQTQETLTLQKEATQFDLPDGSRHDPCVAIRAVAVAEAMVALVLVDALLLNRCIRL